MSEPMDAFAYEDDRRRRQRGDGLLDPWAGEPMESQVDIGGVEVEPRTPEDQRAAMAELLRRIDEGGPGRAQATRDYATELAGGAGVRQALAPALAGPTPPMSAAPPAVQSPPLPSPPAQQGGPLATSTPATAPAIPPAAAAATPPLPIDPASQTVTAESQAQALAAPQPAGAPPLVDPWAAQGTPAPAGAPPPARPADAMAKGAAPPTGGIQARMGTSPGLVAEGPSFDQRVTEAQSQDDRRERWRRILRGVGALLAAATGNVGLMLPGLVGASLVPESDEEETLRAGDTREQAIGTEQARRQAVLDQLEQRRQAQAASEREAQQTLALRQQELLGTQADREARTSIAQAEEGRDAAMLDPRSDVSERNRVQFREWLRTAPREIQSAVDVSRLDGLSATEILTLQDELSSNYNSRQIGGGRGSAGATSAGGQRVGGLNAAPDSFVMNVRMGSPGLTLEQARERADADWLVMPARQRATWNSTEQGVSSARALAQNLPGYEQANPGAVSPQQFGEAQDIIAGEEALGVAMDRAISAAERIEALPVAEQAAARAAGAAGLSTNDDMAEFDDARRAIISSLNRMAGGGTMDQTEYARWDATLPSLSSLRGMAPGAARRALQAAAERARETAQAEMRARGYRRTTQDAPPAPGPEARSSGPRVTLRFRREDGTTRTMAVPESQRAAAIAAGQRNGWTLDEGSR